MDRSTTALATDRPVRAGQRDLGLEIEAHRAALLAFVATAEGIPAEHWNTPREPGKWSSAQVAEHLRLTCEALAAELAGQAGMRVRTKRWQQWLFRLVHLPRILRDGRFPKGVPAVREIRPGDGPFERDRHLAALRAEVEAFLESLPSAPSDARLTHPFLGSLPLVDAVCFAARHIRHHHDQVLPQSSRASTLAD
jgi:hypothetical protein